MTELLLFAISFLAGINFVPGFRAVIRHKVLLSQMVKDLRRKPEREYRRDNRGRFVSAPGTEWQKVVYLDAETGQVIKIENIKQRKNGTN